MHGTRDSATMARTRCFLSKHGKRLGAKIFFQDEAGFQSDALYLEDCKHWAKILHKYAVDLGQVILDRKTNSSAYVLEFASGRRIYCLSSSPTAFISHDMITACEQSHCLENFSDLLYCQNPLYIAVDVARKKHLCVIDVGEKIGDVMYDRLRIELLDKPSTIKAELFRLLTWPSAGTGERSL